MIGCAGKDSCMGCAQTATCEHATYKRLGSILPDSIAINWADWKTWLVIALAAALAYKTFFRGDQRTRRKARSSEIAAAKEKYGRELARIRESYA